MNTKLFYTAFICLILFSCESVNDKEKVSDTLVNPISEAPLPGNEDQKKQIPFQRKQIVDTDSTVAPPQNAAHADWDKKIIKTATLNLEIKDFKIYNESVRKTVKQFGGYIAQEDQKISEEKTSTSITIKVPVDQFEDMMNQLSAGDLKVLERKINTDDVTGEVVDVKSRLQAKMQMRLKYLDFLKASKNMQEVLQVQNEINGIQEQIEAAAGRVNYLTHESAMSTINLSFYQPINGYQPKEGPPSFLTRIKDAFRNGTSWFGELLIILINLWPLILVIFGTVFLIKRKYPSKKQTA